jgi:UDP-glucose 4-epimerase
MPDSHRIFITGANGCIGRMLFKRFVGIYLHVRDIDINENGVQDGVSRMDIRDARLGKLLQNRSITHVVHLPSIVQPRRDTEREYDIDVNGTRNVVEACLAAGVKHLTVTSSGAAYSYHADNPEWLTESHPLRGNDEFSYSRHKRLVEEMLADYRQSHPQLKQLVLRPGSVLGNTPPNMITRLFTGRFILVLRGVRSPFVFIRDQDLVRVLVQGVQQSALGQFNVVGDGYLDTSEISRIVGLPVVSLPVWLLKASLAIARPVGLSSFGPEHVRFIQYRPVLSNERLKSEFGYTPTKTSRQVLEFFFTEQAETQV